MTRNEIDEGRPYGTTRDDFIALYKKEIDDWLTHAEQTHGVLERIAMIPMKDDRMVTLGKFEKSWYVNIFNPHNALSQREMECFLSFEVMCALCGLHEYLTTRQTNEENWRAFITALKPHS